MSAGDWARRRWAELVTAFGLMTRLPVQFLPAAGALEPGTAAWAYPIAGAAVGAIGGGVYAVTAWLGFPAPLAGIFAIVALVLVTGALHEDGLADAADALGGSDPEQRLTIMRDHRIGTYGVIALVASLGFRATAIALLASPDYVCAALMAVGAASRAGAACLMAALPTARQDGLSVAAGRPSAATAAAAFAIAYIIACFMLPFVAALAVLVATVIAVAIVGRAAKLRLGGQTGDVLGAACQIAESLALAVIVAAANW